MVRQRRFNPCAMWHTAVDGDTLMTPALLHILDDRRRQQWRDDWDTYASFDNTSTKGNDRLLLMYCPLLLLALGGNNRALSIVKLKVV